MTSLRPGTGLKDSLNQSQLSNLSMRDSINGLNKKRSKSSIGKRNIAANEFLTNQLDANKLEEYITLLAEFEKTCISEKKFRDAEMAAQRIEELRMQELEYRGYVIEEKNKTEVRLNEKIEYKSEELERLNIAQFEEFNKMWDQLIQEHVEQMKAIEQDMIKSHEEETENFEEELDKIVIPKPKFSKEILNLRHNLNNMIRAKKYSEAEEMSHKLEVLEMQETERWNKNYKEKFSKKRFLILGRQKNEIEALREKLQNSLQEKLRMRTSELQKLLQRFQNMKKELELKQNQEVSKLIMINDKAKKSGHAAGFVNRVNQSYLNTSRNDVSKMMSPN